MFGGRSVEHDVSIITGLQACEQLDQRHQPVPIYIDRDGRWFTGPSLRRIETYRADTLDAEPVVLDLGAGVLRAEPAPAAPARRRVAGDCSAVGRCRCGPAERRSNTHST